jgi:hypothetical protein
MLKDTDYPKAFIDHCQWYPDMLKVKNRVGKIVPFELYDVQKQVEFLLWEAFEMKQPALVDVLKARKEGITTLVTARFFRDALEHDNRNSLTVSLDTESTQNVLRMTKDFVDWYPEEISTKRDSASALEFKDNGSSFVTYTAGSRSRTGRSFTFQAIHFTEFDFYDVSDTYQAAMNSTPNEYPLLVVIESTAQGPDGPMERHWRQAVDGTNGFTPVFFSCFDFAEYRRPLSFADLSRFAPDPWRSENKTKMIALSRSYKDEPFHIATSRQQRAGGKPGSPAPEAGGGSGSAIEATGGPQEQGDDTPAANGEAGDSGRGSAGCRKTRWDGVPRTADGGVDRRTLRAQSTGKRRTGKRPGVKSGKKMSLIRAGLPQDTKVGVRMLRKAFEESKTPYEIGLQAEFGKDRCPDEALAFVRWVQATKCENDVPTRKREYPCRPEEAFEYSAETVLDPTTLAKWAKESAELHTKTVHFTLVENRRGEMEITVDVDDIGRTTIFRDPHPDEKYVMGVDPNGGSKDENGDWFVAIVQRVKDGEQVAEFRARMDPDQAVDQVEALGYYYNQAYTGVEANTYGLPVCRALEDRGTLPMYEREIPDRRQPNVVNKFIGWLTTNKTRNMVFTEIRRAVREGLCPVRSMATISEMRTLCVNRNAQSRLERIEARQGCHDDGVMAYGIAMMMRNRQIDPEYAGEDGDASTEEPDINDIVSELMNKSGVEKPKKGGHRLSFDRHIKHVHGGSTLIDGRRNAL